MNLFRLDRIPPTHHNIKLLKIRKALRKRPLSFEFDTILKNKCLLDMTALQT